MTTVHRRSVDPHSLEGVDTTRGREGAPAAARRRGRKPTHTDRWTKATVVLFDRQIVFLDRLVAEIRAANGTAVSRAHIIRALVDALSASDLELTAAHSEADLTQMLVARLQLGAP